MKRSSSRFVLFVGTALVVLGCGMAAATAAPARRDPFRGVVQFLRLEPARVVVHRVRSAHAHRGRGMARFAGLAWHHHRYRPWRRDRAYAEAGPRFARFEMVAVPYPAYPPPPYAADPRYGYAPYPPPYPFGYYVPPPPYGDAGY